MTRIGASRTLDVPGFAVVKHLGSGARSTIWQLRQRRTGKSFALKRIVKEEPGDGRFFRQAHNEYEVARNFDHPVVRKIHRLRRVRRLFRLKEVHLLMELCEGITLQDKRPETVAEAIDVFLRVAEGVTHMNSRGYLHADVKPNNIVVAPNGGVKIIDLGQSCPIGTIKDRVQGTPDFIAPEQVDRHPLDARTDVFNFGAAMYWVLTGQAIQTVLPKNNGMIFKADMVVTPPEQINPTVPAPLSKLVVECVELLPRRRPQTMKVVSSRLALCAHAMSREPPDPTIELPEE